MQRGGGWWTSRAHRRPPCDRQLTFTLSLHLSHRSLQQQALFDLEATNNELKTELRDLYINSAQEVEVTNGRTAIVIHVSHTPSLSLAPDSNHQSLPPCSLLLVDGHVF
jgi:hypothetical protein